MAVVNSINIKNPSAEPFVSYINKSFLQVFEPELYFKQFAEAPISQRGYKSVTWIKPDRYVVTPAQALLQPGITPVDTPLKLNTIEVTAKQYGIYTVLSDEVLLVAEGYNLAAVTGELLGKNMARIMDSVIQTEVMGGTNVMYASTTSGGTRANDRASLGSTHKIFKYDLSELYARMRTNYSPFLEGQAYAAIIHPSVSMQLLNEATVGGFVDVLKYTTPERILNGELGKMAGIRLVESAYVQPFYNGTINVYPTLVIGYQAYGIARMNDMETIIHGLGSAGTSDALNQRMTAGVKTFFAAKRLQEDSLYRFESAGSF